jgi:YesN/AraC family two-component response regulator
MPGKILICEDEPEVQNLLKGILLKNKYEVSMAMDGKEAIDKTKKIKPDLILLDIRMPKIDGLDVAKRIRKFNPAVKIIFLTGYQSPELTKEAAKYDISDYIVKSASIKDIRKVITEALRS